MKFLLRSILSAACVVAAGSAALGGGAIALRPGVTVDSPRALVLSDVADLSGDAERCGQVEVIAGEVLGKGAGSRGWARVTVQDVRSALAHAGRPTGTLAFSGSECVVRVSSMTPAAAPARNEKAAPVREEEPECADLSGPDTVRARVTRAIVEALDVDAQDLRLVFDPRDAAWLGSLVGDRRIATRALSSNPASGQIAVEVSVLGEMPAAKARTVSVRASVRQHAVRLTRELARKEQVSADVLEEAEMWVTPGIARAASALSLDEAVGQLARSRLSAGQVLTREHLTTPSVVRRNELIDVWVYHGGLAVKAKAMAMKDGGIGDVIPARLDRQRAPFQVRIDGERRGTVVLDSGEPADGMVAR